MILPYLLSCTLLSIAALQYHKGPGSSNPLMVNVAGIVATVANFGMLIAGFFLVAWWAPLVAFVLGPVAYTLLPAAVKRGLPTVLVVLGTLAGLGFGSSVVL